MSEQPSMLDLLDTVWTRLSTIPGLADGLYSIRCAPDHPEHQVIVHLTGPDRVEQRLLVWANALTDPGVHVWQPPTGSVQLAVRGRWAGITIEVFGVPESTVIGAGAVVTLEELRGAATGGAP